MRWNTLKLILCKKDAHKIFCLSFGLLQICVQGIAQNICGLRKEGWMEPGGGKNCIFIHL